MSLQTDMHELRKKRHRAWINVQVAKEELDSARKACTDFLKAYPPKMFRLQEAYQNPEARKRLICIHDADRDVNAWYGVPPERLGRSKRQAIIAAREDLKDKRRELEDEIAARQQDAARIDSMLELG